MYGSEISTMSSSFSITEVLLEKLCTQQMWLKASIRAFARSPKKELFQTKMYCSNCSISELPSFTKKWNGSKVQNWAMVRNQLATNDKIKARIEKYEHLI